VSKRAEKMERSEEKQVVGREGQGRQISKEDKSKTTQQVEKATVRCLGTPHEKETKTGWQSLKKAGQVDLGF
jgi:hypothetical protein